MRFHIDHYHHLDQATAERLARMERLLRITVENTEITMANMDDLRAAVQREQDAEQKAIVLIQGLSQQLKDAQAMNDPSAIQDVINQMDAHTNALAAATTPADQNSAAGNRGVAGPAPGDQNQQNPSS